MRDYLVELRDKKGLTQRDVSSKLGISESYYNMIEHGARQKDMSIVLLYELSLIFKISLKSLVDKELNFIKRRINVW